VGRIESSGPDFVILDLSKPTSATVSERFGTSGTGERLALHGDDLFVGSGRAGLRRLQFLAGKPQLVATWEALGSVEPCTVGAPVMPQPANLSETSNNPITLSWKSACGPVAYELRIDGTAVATVEAPTYAFAPRHEITTWQVTAIDAEGHRATGPEWTFETRRDGLVNAPAQPPSQTLLYVPPPVVVELKSPASVVAATCGAAIVGLVVIVAGAWAIGAWSERRARDG
jgi:hypothetical protein